MEVVRAETAGFCMGVDLALRKLDSIVEEQECPKPIFTFGPIIHNPQVLDAYKQAGVLIASSPEDIRPGSCVVIRAHGIPKQVEEQIKARDARIVDATCPKVKKAQVLIGRMASEGRIVLLYGEENHPEVKGLVSYAEAGAFIFDTPDALDAFPLKSEEKYCLAAQTTQDRKTFEDVAEKLKNRPDLDIEVLHTICDATKCRQNEAIEIAKTVEYMVVVGGLDSGNTRRLATVVASQGTPCVHIETAEELPLEDIRKFKKVGLTAGASTPKIIIDKVHSVLESL